MGLPHHVVKGAGPIFSVEGLVQPASPHINKYQKHTRRVARPHTGLWSPRYVRYPGSRLRSGAPTAHETVRLVLLGSPPDTVHGAALRGTDPSSLLIWGRRHILAPGAGVHPCCSGLQVQGTAISPVSAALFHVEEVEQSGYIVPRPRQFIN